MEKLMFENLPEAMQLVLEKLERLENILLGQQNKKPEPKENIDITAASGLLGLAKATIYSKVCRGEIPAFKLGKKLLFNRKELEAYIEGNKDQTNFHLKKAADEKLAGRIKKSIYTY
ncbi:helix-turn-helix domain-containing protein [Pedobacter sp. UC225_65]|uniref:helix-turn-helix domain-containing protein n=1 Tax=Pedobacter sp. UC225_65 TaxID=3350173 RepID=UPI00366BB84E